ncbi:MAG: type II secretion system protein [Vulcanimicrobiota bacterium]
MRPTRAFSLLEMVMAIFLVALVLAMLGQIIPLARLGARQAERQLGGALLAQNVLETYLVEPAEKWPADPFHPEAGPQLARLERLPWQNRPEITLARVTILNGDEEIYRLETLIIP